MSGLYVMDACALFAFLQNEAGGEVVKDILKRAKTGVPEIHMNALNLLEVYYGIYREAGKEKAGKELNEIRKLPIIFFADLSDDIFMEAGRLKASYRISLADSIALAQTIVSDGELMTADHHEFDIIEKKEPIRFMWIR